MANYTQPDNKQYEDSPKDWLKLALVFGRALGLILREKEGVVVSLQNNMLSFFPGLRKVVVHRETGQIRVSALEGFSGIHKNSPEGCMVWVHNEDARASGEVYAEIQERNKEKKDLLNKWKEPLGLMEEKVMHRGRAMTATESIMAATALENLTIALEQQKVSKHHQRNVAMCAGVAMAELLIRIAEPGMRIQGCALEQE